MFEGFTVRDVRTSGATIRFREGGAGPPLLLLHGNPLTHVSWHRLAGPLSQRFRVIAADLRGYGDSIGPEEGGENHANYSFRAMARDQIELMEQLGFSRFFLAGHDRGARTAHRMCLDFPERVMRAALVDILPSHYLWSNGNAEWAKKSWHWLFMAQPYDLPERMMASVPAAWFLERKMAKPGIGLGFMAKEAFDEYVRCFTWKTIRGSCEDYRACATIDFEMDDADLRAGHLVETPLLAVWGAKSHTGSVHGDILPIWRRYARDVTGGPIDCGHYVPEEAPEELLARFTEFFR